MPTTKLLSLEWKLRQGGGGKTERQYLDFMIDGVSLYDPSQMGDTIGCLGWLPPASEIKEIDKLLLEQPNPYGDAYLLYICPECGDIGCGAVATTITMTDDHVIWSQFRYLNNYDPSMTREFDDIAPIYFAKDHYQLVLRQRKQTLQQPT